jgi:hypothetical protein
MSLLDEWLKFPAAERSSMLGILGMKEAVAALGTDRGVAWLETHIDSPVNSHWGEALFSLRIPWSSLEKWLRLGKFHCLAAMDALRHYAAEGELPAGACAASIQTALDGVQSAYSSPRIKMIAEEIRLAWPLDRQERHRVDIPPGFVQAAEIMFDGDAAFMSGWQQAMGKDPAPLEEPIYLWNSLLEFAESRQILAIIDWRSTLDDAIASLSNLKSAQSLKLAWGSFDVPKVELEQGLKTIGAASRRQGMTLVFLDRGADDFPLTFLPSGAVPILVEILRPFDLSIAAF